jgi:hypothetical protein
VLRQVCGRGASQFCEGGARRPALRESHLDLFLAVFEVRGLPILGGSKLSRSGFGIRQMSPRAVVSSSALGNRPCLRHCFNFQTGSPRYSAASLMVNVGTFLGIVRKEYMKGNHHVQNKTLMGVHSHLLIYSHGCTFVAPDNTVNDARLAVGY